MNKHEFLNLKTRKVVSVQTEMGEVFITSITPKDWVFLMEAAEKKPPTYNPTALAVVMSVCDENGKLLCSVADCEEVANTFSFTYLNKLVEEINILNGFRKKDIDEKKSE